MDARHASLLPDLPPPDQPVGSHGDQGRLGRDRDQLLRVSPNQQSPAAALAAAHWRAPTRPGGALELNEPGRALLHMLCVRNSTHPERRGLRLTRLSAWPAETIRLVAWLEDAGYVYWDAEHRWDLRITDAGARSIGGQLW